MFKEAGQLLTDRTLRLDRSKFELKWLHWETYTHKEENQRMYLITKPEHTAENEPRERSCRSCKPQENSFITLLKFFGDHAEATKRSQQTFTWKYSAGLYESITQVTSALSTSPILCSGLEWDTEPSNSKLNGQRSCFVSPARRKLRKFTTSQIKCYTSNGVTHKTAPANDSLWTQESVRSTHCKHRRPWTQTLEAMLRHLEKTSFHWQKEVLRP